MQKRIPVYERVKETFLCGHRRCRCLCIRIHLKLELKSSRNYWMACRSSSCFRVAVMQILQGTFITVILPVLCMDFKLDKTVIMCLITRLRRLEKWISQIMNSDFFWKSWFLKLIFASVLENVNKIKERFECNKFQKKDSIKIAGNGLNILVYMNDNHGRMHKLKCHLTLIVQKVWQRFVHSQMPLNLSSFISMPKSEQTYSAASDSYKKGLKFTRMETTLQRNSFTASYLHYTAKYE